MGKAAYSFVDLLSESKIKYWQILPLVQTSYGDSPYQSAYSGSGNPYFIDLEFLVEEGLLKKSELSACRNTKSKIDYAFLYKNKYAVLRRAYERFDVHGAGFVSFVGQGRFGGYALFMSIKEKFGGAPFDKWPNKYKFARAKSLQKFKKENEKGVSVLAVSAIRIFFAVEGVERVCKQKGRFYYRRYPAVCGV